MKATKSRSRTHDFTLVLSGVSEVTSELEDALYSAGCDDATLSMRAGRAYLTFTGRAGTLRESIVRAIQRVRSASAQIDVLRVDVDDLVSPAEIARRIGKSRQLTHAYITGKRGPGDFPPPASGVTRDAPSWSWREVAEWLHAHEMISAASLREIQEVSIINSVLELRRQVESAPAVMSEVMRTIHKFWGDDPALQLAT
jgi:hypothetical protein